MSDMYKLRRKVTTAYLGSRRQSFFNYNLSDILEELKSIADKPLNDISDVVVEIGREEDGYETEITLYRQRMETDEEFAQRTKYDLEQQQSRDQREYEEYLRLKKRFEVEGECRR